MGRFKKKDPHVTDSEVTDVADSGDVMSLEEYYEDYDREVAAYEDRRNGGVFKRLYTMSLRRSIITSFVFIFLFSVVSGLFLWLGYEDVRGKLSDVPNVVLNKEGFHYKDVTTGELGSRKMMYHVNFGVKEIELPVYVGKGYKDWYKKDRFALYLLEDKVYVKMYGDSFVAYVVDTDLLKDRDYTKADFSVLYDQVGEQLSVTLALLVAISVFLKSIVYVMVSLITSLIAYGLVALGGRVKLITFKNSIQSGFAVAMLFTIIDLLVVCLPFTFGPELAISVYTVMSMVMVMSVIFYESTTNLYKEAYAKNRLTLVQKYNKYVKRMEDRTEGSTEDIASK